MPTLNDKVYAFAKSHLGQQVGSGECFDLADQALDQAGAKSAADYGRVTPTADYVWGKSINQRLARPGDIIQFRNYRMVVTTVTRTVHPDHSWEENSETHVEERPHHTAIVAAVGQNGRIAIFEQNVGTGKNRRHVQQNVLYFSSRGPTRETTRQGGKTITVTRTVRVSGIVRFYRPQPKKD